MDSYATEVGRFTGTKIHVFGFDSCKGLPPPEDYRDLPRFFKAGFYPMDAPNLKGRLRNGTLILGDVRATVRELVENRADTLRAAPIGFLAFDLDYWSSTLAAFDVLRGDAAVCLPRITCYFDDIVETIEDVGELRAIRDFNEESHGRRMRPPHALRRRLPFEPNWADGIFEAHLFDHADYNTFLADPDAEAEHVPELSDGW